MKMRERLGRLIPYGGKKGRLTYVGIILACVSAVLSMVPFYYIWLIIDEVISVMPDFSLAVNLVHNGWMAVGFTIASVLVYITGLMCTHISAFSIAKGIKKALVLHLAELPAGSFDEAGTGKIRRTVQETVDSTEAFLAHILPDMCSSMVLPVCLLVILLVFDWRLGLASLAVLILAGVPLMSMAGSKGSAEFLKNYQSALMDVNKEAVEYVRGVSVVKTFQQTVDSFQSLKKSIDNYGRFSIGYVDSCRKGMILYVVLLNSIFAGLIAVAFLITGIEWTSEFTTDFLFYVTITPAISVLMNRLMSMNSDMLLLDDSINRVRELLDAEPMHQPSAPVMPDGRAVEFRHVTFTYPGAEVPAVRDFSIRMEPGTVTALVGPSGSGKSTVASLACRFWDPQQGEVSIGGKDLKDIGSENTAKLTAYVFQNNHMLNDTLLNNVRMSKPEATEDEIERALELAQCSDIVAKMPDGLDTLIGNGGVYLSGGEVQRVAIARALLKDAPVVILDEATAFADPENEYLVQRAFSSLTKDRTVLLIAHRLTTVRNADRICVMKDGEIIESGSHDELIAADGTYRRMWDDYQCSLSWKVKEVPE